MTTARKAQISLTDTPYYHCIARCVRRAFLCGEDPFSGCNFEHRRQWIVDRLKQLAGVFAIDICAYAVMSNHYHVVLRVDRAKAQNWSEADVIEHWLQLFKGPVLVHRFLNGEINTQAERDKVAEIISDWRERLGDISWLMRCLNESIARKANQEDRCTGRFWEGRFKSQALLDEAALLTCMAYVDLNPIRAGIAESPETSDYTSLRERILRAAEGITQSRSKAAAGATDAVTKTVPDEAHEAYSDIIPSRLLPLIGNERQNQPDGITFHLNDYLELVDWTGRAIRDDKTGAIPAHLPPILQRLGLDENAWVDNVHHFGRRFQRAVGPVEKIRQLGQALGQRWLQGMSASRELYRPVTVTR